jgi:hypothetical protein
VVKEFLDGGLLNEEVEEVGSKRVGAAALFDERWSCVPRTLGV